MTAFILWLGACRGVAADGPGWVESWAEAAPEAFSEAIRGFAGIASGAGYAQALAGSGGRIVLISAAGRLERPAAALDSENMPSCIAAMLAAGRSEMLARQAAEHLLRLDIRPDERVLWPGGQEDPWPLGALLAGATLVLCEPPPYDPQAVAAAEGARVIRPPV
jgi:hypothetical protein